MEQVIQPLWKTSTGHVCVVIIFILFDTSFVFHPAYIRSLSGWSSYHGNWSSPVPRILQRRVHSWMPCYVSLSWATVPLSNHLRTQVYRSFKVGSMYSPTVQCYDYVFMYPCRKLNTGLAGNNTNVRHSNMADKMSSSRKNCQIYPTKCRKNVMEQKLLFPIISYWFSAWIKPSKPRFIMGENGGCWQSWRVWSQTLPINCSNQFTLMPLFSSHVN